MLDTFTPRDLNFRQLETYFYDLLSLSVCIIRAASVCYFALQYGLLLRLFSTAFVILIYYIFIYLFATF